MHQHPDENAPEPTSPDTSTSSTVPPARRQSWLDNLAHLHPSQWTQSLLQPVQQGLAQATQWFQVSDDDVTAILEQVRQELPTTEVLLLGKPQTGKSSVIRGLTGASADMIGQGFRPHTTHTQRYNYPTGNLPLLVFTDTVGLGEGTSTTSMTEELLTDLQADPATAAIPAKARVIVVTVKITDFATDTLKHILEQVRRQHPEIPCLLAVTCLHDLYPAGVADHPAYPPTFNDLERAWTTIQTQFADLCDRTVLIDFTLEADGYNPVFYGLEPFAETLAELLPEAEARILHQLMQRVDAAAQLGNLYRDAGRRYILPFAVMAGTLAAVPLPFATMPVLTTLQITLVGLLGRLYGQVLTPSQAGGVASAIAGGFVAQAIGRELVKFIPGLGSVIAASWASAYTWALGEAACVYFGDLMGGKTPDPQKIHQVMQTAFQTAKQQFKGALPSRSASSPK